jgi:hypothetical protein
MIVRMARGGHVAPDIRQLLAELLTKHGFRLVPHASRGAPKFNPKKESERKLIIDIVRNEPKKREAAYAAAAAATGRSRRRILQVAAAAKRAGEI